MQAFFQAQKFHSFVDLTLPHIHRSIKTLLNKKTPVVIEPHILSIVACLDLSSRSSDDPI